MRNKKGITLISFNSDDVISLATKNLNDESDEIKSLYNNVCEKLSLEGNSELTDEEINNVLSTMTNLKYVSLKNVTNFTNLDFIKETSIKTLTLQDWNDGRGQQAFDSLVEIGKITSLKELHVKNQKNLTSTRGIEDLTNLTILDLYGSKITNLTGIENLTNLTSIVLNNCDLYDTYLNQNNKKTMKTLEILANLNYKKNGNLKNLELYGNNKITEWNSVANLSWESKKGF